MLKPFASVHTGTGLEHAPKSFGQLTGVQLAWASETPFIASPAPTTAVPTSRRKPLREDRAESCSASLTVKSSDLSTIAPLHRRDQALLGV